MLRDLSRGGRVFVVVVAVLLAFALVAMCVETATRQGWWWLVAFVVFALVGTAIRLVSVARDIPSKRRP